MVYDAVFATLTCPLRYIKSKASIDTRTCTSCSCTSLRARLDRSWNDLRPPSASIGTISVSRMNDVVSGWSLKKVITYWTTSGYYLLSTYDSVHSRSMKGYLGCHIFKVTGKEADRNFSSLIRPVYLSALAIVLEFCYKWMSLTNIVDFVQRTGWRTKGRV